jgi:phage FluMu gp28-like protein
VPVVSRAPESLPAVFLPYQQQLWQAIDEHRLVVIEKSRRTGYSWALGAIAAGQAGLARSEGGSDVLYMGYEKEMTREFIDYVAMFAKSFSFAASEVEEFVFNDPDHPERSVGAFRIGFASTFETIALPSVPRALRGKQGLVILDEAAFMDNLEEVLKAALALLIWGGRVVVCSTHNGETNPFNVLVQDIRAGRRKGHVLRLTFDEAIEQGLYPRICERLGIAWTQEGEDAWKQDILDTYRDNADEELNVIPNPVSGAYLPGPLLEARATAEVPVLRWTCPPGFAELPEDVRTAEAALWCAGELAAALRDLDTSEPHVFGEDFGRVRDLTVIWPLAIGRDLVRRTRFIVELRNVPFRQQEQVLFYLCDRLPKFRAGKMDASGNGAYLAEVAAQRYGARIEQVKLSEPWYREHMPPLKAAIEDGMLTLPRDRDVLGDLRSLKLVRGVARVPERTLTDQNASRHGDAAIAAALAYAASEADPEEYGYQSAARLPAPAEAASRRSWNRPDEDDFRRSGRDVRGSL